MSYPATIDSPTNPSANQPMNNPSHSGIETAQNTAIVALETKVGADSSAVTTSIDYLLKSSSSVSPGHKHTSADITDATAFIPTGAIVPYSGSSVPNSNFLYANGAAVSRTTYATLFGITGTTYGVGDGITTFNLPVSANQFKFIFDSAETGHTSGSTLTFSHTVGIGQYPILFVTFNANFATTITSVTYAGVNMTQANVVAQSTNYKTYLYYLYNPTIGINNVIVTTSAGALTGAAASYFGFNAVPLNATATNSAASGTTLAVSTTVNAGEIAIVCGADASTGGSAPTLSNGTARASTSTDFATVIGDLNSGSSSSTITFGASGNLMGIIASFKLQGGALYNSSYNLIKT